MTASLTSPSTRLRDPRQARSRASLERILVATRELLEERTFEELSVTEIVRNARSSVGAFYTRFADKQALLDHLDELYARDLIASIKAVVGDPRSRDADLVARIEGFVAFLVRFHREQRGLLRALILHARLHVRGRFGERTKRMLKQVNDVDGFILARRDQISHPRPEEAVRFGFVAALTAIRERILFPEGPAALVPLADDELVREVTLIWIAYLGVRP